MASSAFPSQTNEPTTLNSYGSVDIDVLPSTNIISPTNLETYPSDSTIIPAIKSRRQSCLKPHQSETLFAIGLLILGLTLLIYVIISYWFTHSPISPLIIFICGLLCFIPGCYYLFEHYCSCFKRHRHIRHRHLSTNDQDEII